MQTEKSTLELKLAEFESKVSSPYEKFNFECEECKNEIKTIVQ